MLKHPFLAHNTTDRNNVRSHRVDGVGNKQRILRFATKDLSNLCRRHRLQGGAVITINTKEVVAAKERTRRTSLALAGAKKIVGVVDNTGPIFVVARQPSERSAGVTGSKIFQMLRHTASHARKSHRRSKSFLLSLCRIVTKNFRQ